MTPREECKKVVEEFHSYIDVLSGKTAYYRPLLCDVKAGDVQISLTRRIIHKKIDLEWIEAIESAVVALDNVIRKPSKFLQVEEEVKPIELSRNITSRSVQHLSQHSDYISEIKGDEIIPSKILNVYNEETFATYENKFVNTLIRDLYLFVSKRYTEMVKRGQENENSLSITANFDDGTTSAKMNFGISVSESTEGQAKADPIFERVVNLNSVVNAYINSSFVKNMNGLYVRPPIMHTNALMMNRDLRTCLELWQFIQGYEKVGYTISVEQRAEKPNVEVVDRLYTDLAYQYILFREAVTQAEVVLSEETSPAFQPLFVKDIKPLDQKKFNINDCDFRKVTTLPQKDLVFKRKRFSKQQIQIRDEAELALKLDYYLSIEREEKERKLRQERDRLEKERLRRERLEQRRLEKERLEKERLEQERLERLRKKQLRLEKGRLRMERLEQERIENERLKIEREIQKERMEQERIEREKAEQLRLKQLRLEKGRLRMERLEQKRLEDERLKQEREIQKERMEQERVEREKAEQLRLKQLRLEKGRLRMERLEQKRLEEERLKEERETQRVLDKERRVQERIEKERAEQLRLKQLRLEKGRLRMAKLEKERLEKERKAKEKEEQRLLKEQNSLDNTTETNNNEE